MYLYKNGNALITLDFITNYFKLHPTYFIINYAHIHAYAYFQLQFRNNIEIIYYTHFFIRKITLNLIL